MKNLFLCAFVLLAACGGNSNAAPANDPSSTNATSATPAPATTPATTTTSTTTTTTTEGAAPSAAPSAAPGDGKCGAPTTTTSASSLDLCNAECEKLSDKAPEGSRCMPPRFECKQSCKVKFEKK